MSKPKLAIIDHVGSKAGMDYFTGNLATGILENGVDVTVYSNFQVPNFAIFKPVFTGHNGSKLAKAFDFYLGHLKSLVSIKKDGVKEVLIHSFETGWKEFSIFILLRVFRLNVSIVLHDVEGFTISDSGKLRRLIFTNYCKHIFTLNSFSQQLLFESVGDQLKVKTTLIKHGHFISQVNDALTKKVARQQLGWDSSETYFLFFGQIKTVKGLDVLIKAFSKLNTGKLIIAGKVWKDDFDTYQQLISALKLESKVEKHIRFISNEERELFFRACDAVIIPYKKIYQSGVLLMAMSYTKCVIASDLPANKEVISANETGYLFQSENENDLALKMQSVIDHPMQSESIGHAAFKFMESDYNWHLIAESIVNTLFKK